jgi:DNA-binding PadR family transcriptional regulator
MDTLFSKRVVATITTATKTGKEKVVAEYRTQSGKVVTAGPKIDKKTVDRLLTDGFIEEVSSDALVKAAPDATDDRAVNVYQITEAGKEARREAQKLEIMARREAAKAAKQTALEEAEEAEEEEAEEAPKKKRPRKSAPAVEAA